MTKEDKVYCKEIFKDFVATKVIDNEKILIVDWRDTSGSFNYFVRYMLDVERGVLVITGDIGSCIAEWSNHVSPESMKGYLSSVSYFMEKIRCSSNLHTYKWSDVEEDLEEFKKDYMIPMLTDDSISEQELEEDYKEIEDILLELTLTDNTQYPERLSKILEKYEEEWWKLSFGMRTDRRIYLWIIGYQMACDYLGI